MKYPNVLKTPSFLQMFQLVTDPVSFMETSAQEYPDLFTATLLGFWDKLVFVFHPEGLEQILSDTAKFSAPNDSTRIMAPLFGNFSLAMLEGRRHRQRRKVLMPCFHGERMQQTYGHLILDIVDRVFSQLPIGRSFSSLAIMQEITLQVILEAVFGLRQGTRYQKLKGLIGEMLEDLLNSSLFSSVLFLPFLQKDLGPWSPWGYLLKKQRQIHELIYAEISDRRQNPDTDRVDVLSMLITARDSKGNLMTDQELRDELMTLLVAGHETTATALTWAFHWIHRDVAVRERLLREVDDLGVNPDPIDICNIPYLRAVCNESLRISPVLPLTFARVVREPVELMGNTLEPGVSVVGCIYLTHHRKDLYPEPQQFRPERFLDHRFSSYEFMPFGGGVRRCMGEALALLEMRLVIAAVISHYELTLVSKDRETPQRQLLSLAPKSGVQMIVKNRRVLSSSQLVTPN